MCRCVLDTQGKHLKPNSFSFLPWQRVDLGSIDASEKLRRHHHCVCREYPFPEQLLPSIVGLQLAWNPLKFCNW